MLEDPLLTIFPRDACHPEPEFDVARHIEPWKQGRVLEHNDPVRPRAVHTMAVHGDPAGRRLLETRNQTEEGRLPAPRRTHDRDELAPPNFEVHVAQRFRLACVAPE